MAEVLKSILFWLIFLGVIGFSIYSYMQRHQELFHGLRRVPFLRWLLSTLTNFRRWLNRVNRSVASSLESGLRRIRLRRDHQVDRGGARFVSLRRLSPRQKILFYYLAMIRRTAEGGLPRQPNQTPNEYARQLERRLPDVDEDVSSITGYFNEARYSRHEITSQSAGKVQRYWQRIRKALRKAIQSR